MEKDSRMLVDSQLNMKVVESPPWRYLKDVQCGALGHELVVDLAILSLLSCTRCS